MTKLGALKVAIVHYWFVGYSGGERVVESLAEIFPEADLFCLIADPATMTSTLRKHRITTSFLQKIPGSRRWYRHLLPLHPLALEQLDLSEYDLILSSESGPAKGVLSPTRSCHVCYCHSPMRYLWDFYPRYRTDRGFLSRNIFTITAHYLRMWDLASAHHVDEFVANSHNVASRIQKHYRREATVIYPPVDVSTGYIAERPQDYYLVVSRLIDYKRIDLAIEACNRLRRPLRIVGDGEQYKKLRRMAGSQIQFLGRLDDSGVRENYAHCRALLFPGEEDFGIVPVEAQSFGRPVIAFNRGGALETVRGVSSTEAADVDMATGVFFGEQHPDSLVQGIKVFESLESRFSPSLIRDSVERFNPARFKSEMLELISFAMDRHQGSVSRQRKLDEVFS